MLTRDVISQAIRKIEADRIIEETMRIDAIDLFYRPVYAVRYQMAGQGSGCRSRRRHRRNPNAAARRSRPMSASWSTATSCSTPAAEAANMFIPGVNLAKIIVVKGLKLGAKA